MTGCEPSLALIKKGTKQHRKGQPTCKVIYVYKGVMAKGKKESATKGGVGRGKVLKAGSSRPPPLQTHAQHGSGKGIPSSLEIFTYQVIYVTTRWNPYK